MTSALNLALPGWRFSAP